MRVRILAIGLALWLATAVTGRAAEDDIFPFPVHATTLENGLKLVVVPYESPGTIAYFTVVRTGSRDEVEPGHSGFAHFFEHMMFRGTEAYSQAEYNEVLKRIGADSNAFTTDDYTNYHIVGPAGELETLVRIEADRFQNLEYSEEDFRTEALAVLGEYNKNASSPFLHLHERLRGLAFSTHTYRHTTMGFLEDIKRMPEEYAYSLQFFDRYYRPDNIAVLIVGDVEPGRATELVRRYYGDWQAGYKAPQVAAEPPQREAKRATIEWPNPTRPYLMMGYRTPAFSTRDTSWPALDIISELLFSSSGPVYQELVVEKQWVDFVSGGAEDHRDPYLFTVTARVKSNDLLPRVEDTIRAHLQKAGAAPPPPERLEAVKKHLRYRYALSLDSPSSVAFTVAHYLNLTGDVETINRLYAQYQKVSAEDVQRMASSVFRPENSTAVTLVHPAATSAGGEK